MSFTFNTTEDVAKKEGEETLVRTNGIAKLAPKLKEKMSKKVLDK